MEHFPSFLDSYHRIHPPATQQYEHYEIPSFWFIKLIATVVVFVVITFVFESFIFVPLDVVYGLTLIMLGVFILLMELVANILLIGVMGWVKILVILLSS